MVSFDKKSIVEAIMNYKPPPVNKESAIFFYAPAFGSLNYTLLSINVMNPGLLQRVVNKPELTNTFLMTSCLGSALFIAGRPHLKKAPLKQRITYSIYGSILFNMGSVLSWAIVRSLLPDNSGIATIVGLVTGCALTGCGISYLNFNDKNIIEKKDIEK